MAFTEDLAPFFDVDEFAVPASVFAVGGASGRLIFDANGLVLPEMGVQSTSPSAIGPAADWAGVTDGQLLEIQHASGTVGYLVRGAPQLLDDGALVLLTLARQT
jgi:hypothetical protein